MVVSFTERESKYKRRIKGGSFFIPEFWILLRKQCTGQAHAGDGESTSHCVPANLKGSGPSLETEIRSPY